MAIYHLFIVIQPKFSPYESQTIHLAFGLFLVFMWALIRSQHKYYKIIPILFLLIGSGIAVKYIFLNFHDLTARIGMPSTVDTWIGLILIIVVMVATGLSFGWALPTVSIICLLYAKYGYIFSGFFHHAGNEWPRLIASLTTSFSGIYGIILNVSATFIVLFMILGGLLQATGGGDFFVRLALSVGGKVRSAPAQAALIGSGLMGSINGSALANVSTTGPITIPMMKRHGYESRLSGGIEAVASTGGILMPPIMGVVAFVMSGITGIPYLEIIKAAFIPALLYYFTLGLTAHLRAAKDNLKAPKQEDVEKVLDVLKDGGHFFIPIIVIIVVMFSGYSVMLSGFYVVLSIILVYLIRESFNYPKFILSKEFWSTISKGFITGSSGAMKIAVASGVMGIAAHSIVITRLPSPVIFYISDLSGELIIVALLMTMGISIFFGMGIPNVASYVLVAVLGAPALVELGLPVISVHLFILYFSIMANITPPVGACVLVASQIANSRYFQTALTSIRLGLPGFLLPFLFIYQPGILLEGTFIEILIAVISTILGLTSMAFFFEGFVIRRTTPLQRLLLLIPAIGLFLPGNFSSIIGLIVLIIVFAMQIRQNRLAIGTV